MLPNHRPVVDRLYASGRYNLTTHAGLAAFVDAAIIALNHHDPKWGHLKKKPGQTDIHGHGEDSALYKFADGTAWAVDFIVGASGPSPSIGWNPDPVAYYTHADWMDPAEHDVAVLPTPKVRPYPGDGLWDAVGEMLFADYAEANETPNPKMGRWFGRTIWDATEGDETGTVLSLPDSIVKHRKEWRDALGLD